MTEEFIDVVFCELLDFRRLTKTSLTVCGTRHVQPSFGTWSCLHLFG